MRTLVALALVGLLVGCEGSAAYLVAPPAFSRVQAGWPAEPKRVAVEARREDGTPVFVRGDALDFVQAAPAGDAYRVESHFHRTLGTAGIVLGAVALAAGGAITAVVADEPPSSTRCDDCNSPVPYLFIGAAGVTLVVAAILAAYGFTEHPVEVNPRSRRWTIVRPNGALE